MIYNIEQGVWVPKYQTIIVIDHGLDREPVTVDIKGNREVVRFEKLFSFNYADQLIPSFNEMYDEIIRPFLKGDHFVWYHYNEEFHFVWYHYNEEFSVKLAVMSTWKIQQTGLLNKEDIVAKLRLDKKLVCV